MVRLPDDLSENRKKVVKYALESVGKIPYYWGGKAAYAGYDKNGFGTVVSPDYKGRVLRGLTARAGSTGYTAPQSVIILAARREPLR